ncbi:Fasciclin-like arabinogalactan protein 7 [Vitis vinifera]|uniref:Fasciclin-like arabinogalactan protein 7 n=1 Tax=Vitis vinifera TaxID=29760 RepID=A0A438CR94_VITVI|nr:Fasciclin-like arabinogalactan protein 7 [Vitis vinifera]
MEKFFAAISILVKVLVFDVAGTVHIGSGWTNTKMSSSVHSTDPVAVYEVDKVLLPEAIFGTDIPPTLAPIPAPTSALLQMLQLLQMRLGLHEHLQPHLLPIG